MAQEKDQNIFIYNRARLEAGGICDVTSFSEDCVEMALEDGCLALDGEDLKIESFSSESGKIVVVGKICAVTYYNKVAKTAKRKKKNG